MKLNLNVWDITKSVAAIALVIFVWFYLGTFIDNINTRPTIPHEVLVKLEENKLMLQNMRANDAEAEALIARLKKEKGEQAALLEYVRIENEKKDAILEEVGVIVAKLERTVTKLRTAATVSKEAAKTGDVKEDARRKLLAYEMKKIYSKDAKGQEFPIAWAMYFPNQTSDKKWKTGTYPLEFHTTIVESGTEKGTFDRAVEFHIENNTNKETRGKEFPITLTSLEWEKFERKEKQFYFLNPRIGLGATFTNNDIAPKLDISLSSYGKTKRDMDWRFLIFGIGAAKDSDDKWKGIGSFEPFSWNLGQALPLIENLFTAPIITYNTDSDVSYGVGFSIPF